MSAVAAAPRPDAGSPVGDVASPEAYTAQLYEQHSRTIFSVCLRQLRRREDADDAVQTTFVYALLSLRRGVVPQFELPWLLTIARNVCSTRRRSGMRRSLHEAPQDLDALQDRLPGPDRTDVATTADFRSALQEIPDSQRKALLLREWQGLSYDEIGSELGLSQSATEALLFRARQNVAQRLSAGLRSLNAVPLITFLRNAFRTATAKTLAVGAGAAVTIATVPAAQPPLRREQAPPPLPLQTQPVKPRPQHTPAVPSSRSTPRPVTAHHRQAAVRPRTAAVATSLPATAPTPPPVSSHAAPPAASPPAPPASAPPQPGATVVEVPDVGAVVAETTQSVELPPVSVPAVSVTTPLGSVTTPPATLPLP